MERVRERCGAGDKEMERVRERCRAGDRERWILSTVRTK